MKRVKYNDCTLSETVSRAKRHTRKSINLYEVNQEYETEIIGAYTLWNIESGERFWETNLVFKNFLEKHVLVIENVGCIFRVNL